VLAPPLPRRGHTVHLAVVAKASPRQGTNDHALLVEEVEMPPLHRLDMVEKGNRVSARVLYYSHKPFVYSTLNMKVEELA
jgi:hypothetical protein